MKHYFGGRDLLFGNTPEFSAESLTFRVRMAAGIVAILLGLLVFVAAGARCLASKRRL